MANDAQRQAYYTKSRNLRIIVLALLVIATLIVPFFAPLLGSVHLFGFPIGFYLTAQGAIIICVAALFWFVTKQLRTDLEFGVLDDD